MTRNDLYVDYIEASDSYGVFDVESGLCVFENFEQSACDDYLKNQKCDDCGKTEGDFFEVDFDTDNGIVTKPICKECYFKNYV